MATVTLGEILSTTGGRVIHGNPDGAFTGISIDSRTIREGELFIALRGQKFDGHDFLMDAMKKGRGAIVSNSAAARHAGERTVVCVEDTLRALQAIARSMRMRGRLTVIGITGTNGKTTTKELVASILGVKHTVMKNAGNLNNQIGLPLSLTRRRENDEFAVLEMGASANGEIRELCSIALPDYGIITNIGPGHLEGFGSLDMVRQTKLELFDEVKMIALNADDRFLMEGVSQKTGKKMPEVITFGMEKSADVYARNISLEERHSVFDLCVGEQCTRVAIHVGGRFNIDNALAAAALCHGLGVSPEEIKEGIESFKGVPMRLELKELFGARVISDAYNANPASMEEAIRELVRLRKDRAVAVLGDMLELGTHAEEAHRRLGKWMAELPVDVFIAVGEMMAKAAEEFSAVRTEAPSFLQESRIVLSVSDSSVAGKILSGICCDGDTILVKGSREMRMERALGWENGTACGCLKDPAGGPLREASNAL